MNLRLLCLAGIFLARSLLAAAPAVEGVEHVRTVGGITEYRLPVNDLNILLLEDRSAPVLTFMVTYRVGSRNEVTGTTGASSTTAGRNVRILSLITPLARLPKVMLIAPSLIATERIWLLTILSGGGSSASSLFFGNNW